MATNIIHDNPVLPQANPNPSFLTSPPHMPIEKQYAFLEKDDDEETETPLASMSARRLAMIQRGTQLEASWMYNVFREIKDENRLKRRIRMTYHEFAIGIGPTGLNKWECIAHTAALILILGVWTDWSLLTLTVLLGFFWATTKVPFEVRRKIMHRLMRHDDIEGPQILSGEIFVLGMFTAWFLLFGPRLISSMIGTVWTCSVGNTARLYTARMVSNAIKTAWKYASGEALKQVFYTSLADQSASVAELGIQTGHAI